jgi:hypothetical protein
MGDVTLVLVVVGVIAAVVWVRRRSQPSADPRRTTRSAPVPSARPVPPETPALPELERQMMAAADAEARRLMRQVEAEAAWMMRQVDAQAQAIELFGESAATAAGDDDEGQDQDQPAAGVDGGPSWMEEADWDKRVSAYERQGRTAAEIAATATYLERRGPKVKRTRQEAVARSAETGVVTRDVYVAKNDEARYLTRDEAGLPTLRLVDSGDRLSIWSPVDGGALVNPKGPGLRAMGLCTSYARGSKYNAVAFKAADLRKGKWVDLVREPDNQHDKNAVAMCAPGSSVRLAHVQRGRAPAIARRMDGGEDMAAVSLRGPGAGRDDDTAFVLIGSREDLTAILDGS